MGQYMQQSKVSLSEIEDFYFRSDQGHFTPAGHVHFADAIYTCFYDDAENKSQVESSPAN